jgi:hypothetical protein
MRKVIITVPMRLFQRRVVEVPAAAMLHRGPAGPTGQMPGAATITPRVMYDRYANASTNSRKGTRGRARAAPGPGRGGAGANGYAQDVEFLEALPILPGGLWRLRRGPLRLIFNRFQLQVRHHKQVEFPHVRVGIG